MGSRINKIGEENINTFGSKMIIFAYRKNYDVDVYFPEYDWMVNNREYREFKNGKIKCPYERKTYGIGYIGEGKYKTKENGKLTKCYNTWHDMLKRCYDEKLHKKRPTYKDCEVCEEWLCFQNFAEWYYNNYYEVEGERMCLDKDILVKHNKIYSKDTCIFVPERINTLFIKCDRSRGEYPIGVFCNKNNKYQAKCSIYDLKNNNIVRKSLGVYDTPEKAFEIYKEFKEKHIKEIADHYKDEIPQKLYNVMYNYEVEIND